MLPSLHNLANEKPGTREALTVVAVVIFMTLGSRGVCLRRPQGTGYKIDKKVGN